MRVNWRGYSIDQFKNNNYMILRDDGDGAYHMVMHCECDRELNERELKEQIDYYIGLKSEWEKREKDGKVL